MSTRDIDHNARGLCGSDDCIGDLCSKSLLHLKAFCVDIDDTGDFAEADYGAARYVSNVARAVKR